MDVGDPVGARLNGVERLIWRQQAPGQALARNRMASVYIMLGFVAFVGYVGARAMGLAFQVRPPIDGLKGMTIFGGACALLLLALMLGFLWDAVMSVYYAGRTHYALTSERFMIIDPRGAASYGPEAFARMTFVGDPPILLFDWRPSGGRSRRPLYHARVVGADDPAGLAALIRQTFRLAD